MSRQEEIANMKKTFQTGTLQDKLEYLWDYYKWHFIFFIVFCIFIVNMCVHLFTKKPYVLQGCFFNTYGDYTLVNEFQEEVKNELLNNPKSEDLLIDTTIYYDSELLSEVNNFQVLQSLTARVAAGEIDFIVAEADIMQQLAYSEYFYDLSDVLTEEQLALYEPYFLYYDQEILTQLDELDSDEDTSNITIPDLAKPEDMSQPVPVMIYLENNEKLSVLYPNSQYDYAFAFVVTSKNWDKTIEFLDYMME